MCQVISFVNNEHINILYCLSKTKNQKPKKKKVILRVKIHHVKREAPHLADHQTNFSVMNHESAFC